jgi:hypothetical protein
MAAVLRMNSNGVVSSKYDSQPVISCVIIERLRVDTAVVPFSVPFYVYLTTSLFSVFFIGLVAKIDTSCMRFLWRARSLCLPSLLHGESIPGRSCAIPLCTRTRFFELTCVWSRRITTLNL